MTLDMIRQKASEHRSTTRRGLIGSIATALMVIGLAIFGVLHTSNVSVRLADAVAILWALAGQSFLHRGMWSGNPAADATFSTGLEFYRREVERRQNLVRRILGWSFGPIVLSICTFIVTFFLITRGGSLRIRSVSVMPFTILFVIWIILFFVLRSRGQRKLRREIDELSGIKADRR